MVGREQVAVTGVRSLLSQNRAAERHSSNSHEFSEDVAATEATAINRPGVQARGAAMVAMADAPSF